MNRMDDSIIIYKWYTWVDSSLEIHMTSYNGD